jgi:hypothetical protein
MTFPIPEGFCLIDDAVTACAQVLLKSWAETLKDDPDFSTGSMKGDVQEVIESLQVWQRHLSHAKSDGLADRVQS